MHVERVLTQDVGVAEMWRRGWRGRRGWSEGGRRLPEVGVAAAGGGGHGWCDRGGGGGQVLEVLLPWFILLQASPLIRLWRDAQDLNVTTTTTTIKSRLTVY